MLYTGHGDGGFTNLIGGPPLPKCDRRLEAIGALDEAQASLGLARALLAESPWPAAIARVQADLRLLMAELASPQAPGAWLTDEHLARLEADLRAWDVGFRGFITPGDSVGGAHLHIARTVIRRAERQVVGLAQAGDGVPPLVVQYLNRLSSWIYALALCVDADDTSVPHVA
jgi:cob(I)alamin adenosyltransferase